MTIQYNTGQSKSIILRDGDHQFASLYYFTFDDFELIELEDKSKYKNGAILMRLLVSPKFRKMGYSKFLLNEFLRFVKSNNIDFIGVNAKPDEGSSLEQHQLEELVYSKIFNKRGLYNDDGQFLYSDNINDIDYLVVNKFKFGEFI